MICNIIQDMKIHMICYINKLNKVIRVSIIKFDWFDYHNFHVFTMYLRYKPRISVNSPVAAVTRDKTTGAKPGWIRMVDRTDQEDI